MASSVSGLFTANKAHTTILQITVHVKERVFGLSILTSLPEKSLNCHQKISFQAMKRYMR